MTYDELHSLINSDEDFRIERTTSTTAMDKFQEAICAFANDLPGLRKKGYLLIGVRDNGTPCGLKVDDSLMKRIAAIRSDGNILPLPTMTTEKVSTPEGDVLVVEVTPMFSTPVRYRGRTFIRIGPRRDIATLDEERILAERCTAAQETFDVMPCREATLEDLDIEMIERDYLPNAIDSDVLASDHRTLKEQLVSLRLYNLQHDCPNIATVLLFGKNPKFFFPGAYVQFVRFAGLNNGSEILNEREFRGNIFTLLPRLEQFIDDAIVTRRPVFVSTLREKDVFNYPAKALRELMMNAYMHRDYQSNMPIRLYQYADRIEVMNAGGLYGKARPENFPHVNDYRNPVIAEALKIRKYVNRFNRGISSVQELLLANASPAATFDVNLVTAFKAIVPDAEYAEAQAVTRVANVVAKELSERQRTVYEMIRDSVAKGVVLNADIIAQQLAVSSRSIQRDLNVLAAKQLIRHIGSKKTGNWEPTLE